MKLARDRLECVREDEAEADRRYGLKRVDDE